MLQVSDNKVNCVCLWFGVHVSQRDPRGRLAKLHHMPQLVTDGATEKPAEMKSLSRPCQQSTMEMRPW